MVLIVDFPVALPWAAEDATTILQVTHASQELGNALADVLFGDVNPGGRLAQTWPRHPESKVARLSKPLRGFQRVTLAPGETRATDGFADSQELSCAPGRFA